MRDAVIGGAVRSLAGKRSDGLSSGVHRLGAAWPERALATTPARHRDSSWQALGFALCRPLEATGAQYRHEYRIRLSRTATSTILELLA